MESKCSRKGCNFIEEVAHMDEALDKLQQHYRAVHPTKGFYRSREIESLEGWNLTADEYMESYNLNVVGDVPEYDWRTLRSMVNRFNNDRYAPYVNPTTQAEVERRVAEHDAQQPAPVDAQAAPAPGRILWDAIGAPAVVPPFDAGIDVALPDQDGGF